MSKHFPSLFVVTNSEHARWFVVHKNKAEEIEDLNDPHDRYSDREGFFGSRGHGFTFGGGEPELKNPLKHSQLHHHLRLVAKKTADLWKERRFKHLGVAAPAQHKNIVQQELQKEIGEKQITLVAGNYGHVDKQTIRTLFAQNFVPHSL